MFNARLGLKLVLGLFIVLCFSFGMIISFTAVADALPKEHPANTAVPVNFHSTIINLYGVGPLDVSLHSKNPLRLEYVGSHEPAYEDIKMEFAQIPGQYEINAEVPTGSWVVTSSFSADEVAYVSVETVWTTRLETGRALLNLLGGFVLLLIGTICVFLSIRWW